MSDITVLGAGMAGYGAAHFLSGEGKRPLVFDKNAYFGGHTNSYTYDEGFIFDEGPHISFTKDERMQELLASFVGGRYEKLQAQANNYYQGHWIKHPAQCNLHGLPVDLVTQIITEFAAIETGDTQDVDNYEQWLKASFGETFATTFPMPYGKKYHTTDARNMSTDWLGPRLYRPDLKEVIRGALTAETEDVHYISHFRYPTVGGFKSYLADMPKHCDLQLDHDVVSVNPKNRQLGFKNGRTHDYQKLVSSLPLSVLIPMIDSVPADVRRAAELLACTKCVIVNIGIQRTDVSAADWTYIYDEDICFARLSFPSRFSPNNAPDGMGSIQAEVYFSDKYKPLQQSVESCIPMVVDDLKKCGLLRDDDVIVLQDAKLLPHANIIFDLDRAAAVELIHGYLNDINIHYCGRYGEWAYIWTDESFLSGERAAMQALRG